MKISGWAQRIERIRRLAPVQGGVFTSTDLYNLLASGSPLQNARIIRVLVREGILKKIQRGFYSTPEPDPWVLAARLREGCYISMDSVLAKNGLVGTVAERSVSAVVSGKARKVLRTPVGQIRFFSIQPDLVFGVSVQDKGVRVVDNEKAFLDLLYFYNKGARFVFDPRTEVQTDKLDRPRLLKYLKKYRNPKFVRFVEGVIQ